jgi:hypothetical protein
VRNEAKKKPTKKLQNLENRKIILQKRQDIYSQKMAQLLSQLENRKNSSLPITRKTQTPNPNKNPHNSTQATSALAAGFSGSERSVWTPRNPGSGDKKPGPIVLQQSQSLCVLGFSRAVHIFHPDSKPRVSVVGASCQETPKRREISFGSGIPAVFPAFALGAFTAFARQSTQQHLYFG